MAPPAQTFRRRRKLIEPKLQLKLIGTFLLLGAISTLLQAINLIHALNTSSGLGGESLAERGPQLVFENLLFGFAICVPLVVLVGVYVTFQLVGPLYRFRVYLKDLAAKGYTGPCRIRKGDEFQELCDALNGAVDSLRKPSAAPADARTSSDVAAVPTAPLPSSAPVTTTV